MRRRPSLSSEKPLRILIVEDEILIALELESLLQDLGHDVVGMAASSRDALSLGQELKPDLAFVDIHLADGPTGVDVARHLAAQHQVTVLFMTANTKRIPEDFAGAWGVIAKPYTERGVREALGYVMAGQSREPDDARTVTFVPFGAAPRERSSQVS
ncbi:MAG: response regulator [Microvirga sp.]|uniref:Response regulator n=1 Tax=Microvirga tunisiensis TaxID=2108360 RepID=A0A5N7MQ03_9HYPH|nr:response regulator [Microvirga tunisiensis]MPR10964.1 response regulator [Microvirga tunisiensis]MPR29102.1 response regulator [Microvirga tunisiensis]